MKKVLSVALIVLCAGAFAFGDAYAKKPGGEQVNGVSRINASGDIQGTIQLEGCGTDPAPKVLVFVPGQSIMARAAVDPLDDAKYSFVLYNVPVPVPTDTVEVNIEVLDGVAISPVTTIDVAVTKHAVVKIGDPVPISVDCKTVK